METRNTRRRFSCLSPSAILQPPAPAIGYGAQNPPLPLAWSLEAGNVLNDFVRSDMALRELRVTNYFYFFFFDS